MFCVIPRDIAFDDINNIMVMKIGGLCQAEGLFFISPILYTRCEVVQGFSLEEDDVSSLLSLSGVMNNNIT